MNKLPILILACSSGLALADAGVSQAPPSGWSFRNHVQAVLTKAGCNSGACHGAAAGKNGFKLSLRGYDDRGDHLALTRHAWGRRVSLSDPGQSLILLKGTATVPHKGEKRFATDSLEYKVLAEWIASGAPGPKTDDPIIERIELQPDHSTLKAGESVPLKVLAHFSDRHSEDVTRWVKYTSTQQTVAVVDDFGQVKVVGHGEAAITAWYLSKIATATVTVPYANAPSSALTESPSRNFIDELVLAKLKELNLPPSPRCDDGAFLRRAYLDATGALPTPEKTRQFLADTSADKRDRLIEELLNSSEFVDYWAYKWSDLLLVQSERLSANTMWSYYHWIRDQVAANTPWDEFARRLLLAQGSTLENGAASFFVLHADPKLLAETTTQTFLGMSVNCAQCHNHPMEKWTNNDYYAFANLFSRVRVKNGTFGEQVIFATNQGDLVQPLTGKPQKPRPLDAAPVMAEVDDRRKPLADWLTSKDNKPFARAVINRVWANFMGVGLVMSVDDMRSTNPASNEALLAKLADTFAQDFDLKALMRSIMQSETYQRDSKPLAENAADTRFHARYYPRRLMAEVLLDAMSHVTGAPTNFPNYPRGWRALQLPDSKVASYFLKSFGRAERNLTCECERTAEPSVTQVLHLANGNTLNEKLSAADNRISALIKDNTAPEKIVEEAYLAALCRLPTDKEKAGMLAVLNEAKPEEKRKAVEDVFWAVMSCKEFLFNR